MNADPDMSETREQLQARLRRLELLYQVSKVIHSTLDPEEALHLILRETVKLMDATSGSVVLLNPTNRMLEIHATHGLPADADKLQLQPSEGITGWVARKGQAARVANVSQDPRYISVDERIQSELAVPLFVDGECRGVLNMDSERPDAFSGEDQDLLEELAELAASVIRNTWIYEQFRLKAELFESLASVGQAINSTLNLDDTLQVITREAHRLMDARVSSIHLLDPTGEWLETRANCGAGEVYLSKPRLSVAESLLGTVIRRQSLVQEEDVQSSGRYQHGQIARDEGLVSLLSVPLVFGGASIGVLNVYKARRHTFSNEEQRILSALAALSAVAIEKARLYERVVDVEEQLRRSEQLSAVGLLAAEVAHEIRNPLTVLKMLYHSLDLNFPEDDPRSKDARIMGEKMDHMNKIVEQILDFARRSEPSFTSVDANQLLDDLALLTRHKLQQQNIELVRRSESDLPMLRADATQLEQAFLNLTLNAVDAMPEGGILTVVTKKRLPGKHGQAGSIQIDFKDTGVGMTEAQTKQVFSSWFTGAKSGGTGLGLAIVSRVVETHGGKVTVKSTPKKGTTFSLSFPLE